MTCFMNGPLSALIKHIPPGASKKQVRICELSSSSLSSCLFTFVSPSPQTSSSSSLFLLQSSGSVLAKWCVQCQQRVIFTLSVKREIVQSSNKMSQEIFLSQNKYWSLFNFLRILLKSEVRLSRNYEPRKCHIQLPNERYPGDVILFL